MENEIKVGDKIPDFSAKSFDGVFIEPEDLLGDPFVLYFYPKDDTPGCTSEACSFRDNMKTFDDMNVKVLGISPDNPKSHAQFIQKYDLNFFLLCDEKMEVARKFGVVQMGPKKGIIRSTFVVDSEGIVQWIEKPVQVENHTERVLEEVKRLVKK